MRVGGRASATDSAAAAALRREKQQNEATLLLQKKKQEEEAALLLQKKQEEEAALLLQKKKQEEEAALLLQKKKQEKDAALLLQKKKQEEDALQIDAVVSVYSGAAPARLAFDLVNKWCDNFSPGKKLGDGTFGEVYQGVFCDSNKRYYQVAVKRLSSSNLLLQQTTGGLSIEQIHGELLNNLKREVNTLSAFRHDNIIKLLGYSLPDRSTTSSSANNTMCLILELGTRGGLHTHLRDDGNAKLLTWKRRLTVLARVSTALNYLHSHHANPCFHRDVKSANIVLTSDYQPKLIDCGLSKYIPDDPAQQAMSVFQSTIGQRFGTPAYMDPKYSNDGIYDAKSEIYSFGIVIAELLTGSLQGLDGIDYDCDIGKDDLIPDSRLVDNPFPVECVQVLQELVVNCLESKKKRISSMAAVMRQLLALERRHCVCSEEEAHYVGMIHGMEAELQQLRLSTVARTPSVEKITCLSCREEVTVDHGVKCSNMSHFLCDGCFRSNVTNQLASEYRSSFDLHDSNIVCKYCLPTSSAYSRQQLVCHVTDAQFNQYIEVKQQVIDAKKKEAETEASLCAICLENPKTHCFVPCGHVCVCSGCAGNSRNFNGKCPMCRAKFTTIFRPFI